MCTKPAEDLMVFTCFKKKNEEKLSLEKDFMLYTKSEKNVLKSDTASISVFLTNSEHVDLR